MADVVNVLKSKMVTQSMQERSLCWCCDGVLAGWLARKVGCVGVWDALCVVTVGPPPPPPPPPPPHSVARDETGPHAHTPNMHTHILFVSACVPHNTDIIKSHYVHTPVYTISDTYRKDTFMDIRITVHMQTKRTIVTSPPYQPMTIIIPTRSYSNPWRYKGHPSLPLFPMQALTALAYRY